MKKIFLSLVILLVKFSFAQHVDTIAYTGIFMTAQDYAANKLSYTVNCDSSAHKIKTDCIFSQNHVKVINNGKKIKLNKDSIFGYRNCKQKDFRFYKNDDREYRIMENKGMVIYVADVRLNSTTGKTFILVPAYFFSRTLSSEILPLNVINLKRTFPENLRFHDSLDVEFTDVNNLSAFDSVHKMYRVNYLLSQSVTK